MRSPEIERLLGLLADIPLEMRPAVLLRECRDAAMRNQVAALLRYAEEAESYFDSVIRGVPASRAKEPKPSQVDTNRRDIERADRTGTVT